MKKTFAFCAALSTLALLCSLAGTARASEVGVPWDKFPKERVTDLAALQHGAKLFVNYCLNCHAAASMRYSRMKDIGLTDEQIKSNLLFAADKVGETMKVSLDAKQGKEWFGAAPPDLSVIARARAGAGGSGADFLYTYMRGFYPDASKPTGWNNIVFPSVAMPHVWWQLQGEQRPVMKAVRDEHDPSKSTQVFSHFEPVGKGALTKAEYDDAVADLVAFLQWMGEPAQNQRVRIGVWVLLFLCLLTFVTWRLNAAYWKDVH